MVNTAGPDPGGGGGSSHSVWPLPKVVDEYSHGGMADREFPKLGSQGVAGEVIRSSDAYVVRRSRKRDGHPGPVHRRADSKTQLATSHWYPCRGERVAPKRAVQGSLTKPLSALAPCFTPSLTPDIPQTPRLNMDMDLHRSPATTGVGEMESLRETIENNGGPVGSAKPIKILQPVALADVAEPSGSAGTDASGSVNTETRMRTVSDGIGASGSQRNRTDVPAGSESCFVTENSSIACMSAGTRISGSAMGKRGRSLTDGSAEARGQAGYCNEDSVRVEVEVAESDRLGGLSVKDISADFEDITRVKDDIQIGDVADPDLVRQGSEKEQTRITSGCSIEDNIESNSGEEDAIIVGTVGSAAPWYLTGWANDVEVEFMIDTGWQVTILATSVFERMCEIYPEVELELTKCTQRLISADKSPLTVLGRIRLEIVFLGLQCDIWCVVAAIGTDGLLGTEALRSCLPHQLDLRTGQLWAEGRSTLQLHQQRSTPLVSCSLITAVVLPPDSEVVAEFSITGTRRDSCALIDPNWELTEEFGVMIGHTLVDATLLSANVLMINLGEDEVVLPSGSLIGTLFGVWWPRANGLLYGRAYRTSWTYGRASCGRRAGQLSSCISNDPPRW